MFTVASLPRVKQNLLLISLSWILVWVIPWGKALSFGGNLYLIFLTDMTKLSVAFGTFILPGALLYILLQNERDLLFDLGGLLPVGFALSVAIVAVIGIFGRIFGFSFSLIKGLFALIGLGELVLLSFLKPRFSIRKEHFSVFFRSVFENIPLLLALILAISMTFNGYQFFIDDTTYAAYLTNWQFSTHLGFNNIVHHMNIIEDERFWLAMYPMGQALLSDLSGVAGILLFSNYLELFLVSLAVITIYWFARVLGLSRTMAGFSVLIQITFYSLMINDAWPVGFWFFQNMAEDKVTAVFLLAPVFFSFVLKFLADPIKSNMALVFFGGGGLMLTHPVILFLSCVVAAGLTLFSYLMKKTTWQEVLQLATLFVVVMLPYAAIRLYSHPSQASIPFDAESVSTTFQAERYVNVLNDVFYGLNPEVLKLIDISPEIGIYSAFQVFRLLPVILALIAGVLAFTKLREGAVHWYVAICVLLVAIATIPHTGWILGCFISARMISRVSWFSPLGLAGALVLILITDPLKKSSIFRRLIPYISQNEPSNKMAKSLLTSLTLGLIVLLLIVLPRAPLYFEKLDHNNQLAQIGAYIDQNTSGPVVVIALNYTDIQMLPSVSSHASLISFREEKNYNPHNYFFSIAEIQERMDASNTIRSLDLSVLAEEKCALLDRYDVRFVVAEVGNAELFESSVAVCKRKIVHAFETKDMILLKFR